MLYYRIIFKLQLADQIVSKIKKILYSKYLESSFLAID